MKQIKSKNIEYIHYDAGQKLLHIKFHNSDHLYHYHGIPNHVYIAFENAQSHGEHFAEHIKDKFKHKKIVTKKK